MNFYIIDTHHTPYSAAGTSKTLEEKQNRTETILLCIFLPQFINKTTIGEHLAPVLHFF